MSLQILSNFNTENVDVLKTLRITEVEPSSYM